MAAASAPERSASVPGGFYSREVAETAAAAGVRALFNSEPVTQSKTVGNCRVFGRYTLWHGMDPKLAAAFAAGKWLPRARQWAWWSCKKVAKKVGGTHYIRLKDAVLREKQGMKGGRK